MSATTGTPADAVPPAAGAARQAPLIEAHGLGKSFGGFHAVSDVSFGVPPGEVTAMIGPNGAGKSTVINLLSGVLLPTSGEVHVKGLRVDGLKPHEIAERGLARTFQTPRLFGDMTSLESTMLARHRFGRSGTLGSALRLPRMTRDEEEARAVALQWLEFVGLGDAAELPAAALPVGRQRLLEVARALACEPDVVLLDEPAAGLDHTETEHLSTLVRSLAGRGLGVLLVEHDMRMVMAIADRVLVLVEGRLIATGTPPQVGANEAVIDAYLGVGA